MMELRLGDALRASVAGLDPTPDLAAFGAALTQADRSRRNRTVAAAAGLAAAACIAGVVVAQASDSSRSVDVPPADRTHADGSDVDIAIPSVVTSTTALPGGLGAPASPVTDRPDLAAPEVAAAPAGTTTVTERIPPPPPAFTASAQRASGSDPTNGYFGTAPAGQTVNITSAYGGGSTVADGSGHWSKQVSFPGVVGSPGTTFPVTISTTGFTAQITFTYTGP